MHSGCLSQVQILEPVPLSQRSHLNISVRRDKWLLWYLSVCEVHAGPQAHSVSPLPVVLLSSSHHTPTLKYLAHWLLFPSFSSPYNPAISAMLTLFCLPLPVPSLTALSLGNLFLFLSFSLSSLLSWPSPVCWPCSVYYFSPCSGLSQMTPAVLFLQSTIKTFPSTILWSSHVLNLYTCNSAQKKPTDRSCTAPPYSWPVGEQASPCNPGSSMVTELLLLPPAWSSRPPLHSPQSSQSLAGSEILAKSSLQKR